jgi:hypothetical protein
VRLYKIINDSTTCEKLKKDIFKVPHRRFSHDCPRLTDVLGHQNAEYQQSFLALIEKYGGVNERDSGRFPACALWEVIAL